MNESIALVLAAAGALAAVVLGLRSRSAASEAAATRARNEKLGTQLHDAREKLAKQSGKLAQHDEEVASLRKRLEKAKRRAGAGSGPVSQSSSLERESVLEEVRQARDAARREAEELAGELTRLRAELADKPIEVKPEEDPLIEELRQARDAAGSELAAARQSLEETKKTGARLQKKLETQNLLYVSLRSELDAKKDRLRTQQELIERLQALEVSLGTSGSPAAASEETPETPD